MEYFNQTNESRSTSANNLNLCSLSEVAATLSNDFKTHGPGLLDNVTNYAKQHPGETTLLAAGAALGLGAVAVAGPVETGLLMAAGATCGLGAVGKISMDALQGGLPMIQFEKRAKSN
jgi:hypothetical protein